MTSRKKAGALAAPQSREAAIGLLTRFAELDGQIAARRERMTAAIAAIRADADALDAPLAAEQKAILAQLQPWWAVMGPSVAGDRRSAELGGCLIGVRLTPPKLKTPGTEADAVFWLRQHDYDGLVRAKWDLDKPAIVRALGVSEDDPIAPSDLDDALLIRDDLREAGFTTVQRDEFFVERLAPQAPAEQVAA